MVTVSIDTCMPDARCRKQRIGHVNEYPTMHYFGNPKRTQSMIAYMILSEYLWKFQ